MAQENKFGNERTGAANPSSNILSGPATSPGAGIDPETRTISTTTGAHTGRESGSEMKQQAGEMADRAQGKAHQAADQARGKANQLAGQAKSKVTGQLSTQKDRATESISSISDALRETSGSLRNKNQDSVAHMVDSAARQVDSFNSYLRDHSVNELLNEAERLARREPALFIGGAFVLGLLGARFFKSSSPERDYYGYERSGGYGGYDSRDDYRPYPRTPGTYRGVGEYGTAGGYSRPRTRTYEEYETPVRSSVGQPRGWEAE